MQITQRRAAFHAEKRPFSAQKAPLLDSKSTVSFHGLSKMIENQGVVKSLQIIWIFITLNSCLDIAGTDEKKGLALILFCLNNKSSETAILRFVNSWKIEFLNLTSGAIVEKSWNNLNGERIKSYDNCKHIICFMRIWRIQKKFRTLQSQT